MIPYKRKTIIGVIEWLTSHPDIDLMWSGHQPAHEDEWTNPCGIAIDGADAIAILRDSAAFNAAVNARIASGVKEVMP